MTRLLTVILNWRTPDMTLRAARSALVAMQEISGEILIVDNDSGDGSEERMREGIAANGWSERVRLIQSGHNGGFGAGNNVGICAGFADGGRPDFVYILNSDAFPEPEAIAALLAHMDAHPNVGLAGSLVNDPDGTLHLAAFRFPSLLSEIEGPLRFGPVSRLLARYRVWMDVPAQTGPVDWVSGASLMIRSELLDEIGFFDETFFLYFEETDLCRRARDAGFETHFVRESRVEHIGSVSTGMGDWARVPQYWFDSRRHYFRKHHGAGGAVAATLLHAAAAGLHRLRCRLMGRDPGDPPHYLRDLLRHELRHWRRADSGGAPA
ncbi:glycosyltransferase family 2 protein [Limimaricola variabilis]|uniref:glycosyltransferase family 2 protein n=1 Tax=Limimaricola variabilis TaxID=1492771 RepID=UPI002AC97C96|nr:glycosyltransferase family 2 protein [Limimaricola variabilis]WPY93982.1 glycosyltransferase family 2 protein [Limimaricola variabilis]